jgi:hypothetical protein
VKDNHTRCIRRCSESNVDECIVYPIDVSLDFNDTATELNGWCAPKSAVCGFHADNDFDTLKLLAERGRVNCKVTGNREGIAKLIRRHPSQDALVQLRALYCQLFKICLQSTPICFSMTCVYHYVSAEPMEDGFFQ